MAGTERAIRSYGRLRTTVTAFKSLDRILTDLGNDWPPVVSNLCKSRKRWEYMSRILGIEGADTRTLGNFGRWEGSSTGWPTG